MRYLGTRRRNFLVRALEPCEQLSGTDRCAEVDSEPFHASGGARVHEGVTLHVELSRE
jgi:hypothetical protein